MRKYVTMEEICPQHIAESWRYNYKKPKIFEIIAGADKGKKALIFGTSKEVLEIDNVLGIKWFDFPPAFIYVMQHPPTEGTVYYGKIENGCYFFHESWIKWTDPKK